MAKFYDNLTDELAAWVRVQPVFFVASAPLDAAGHVNLSPRGLNTLRVLDATTIAYADLTGSGNETSAHIHENGRLTFMWCAFDGPPRILRAFGRGEVVLPGTPRWAALAPQFTLLPGTRQLIVNHVAQVQTSCGFGVPLLSYTGERDTLVAYAERKGSDEMHAYRTQKNAASLDGLPTPLAQQGFPRAD